jgi:hypothetical protein
MNEFLIVGVTQSNTQLYVSELSSYTLKKNSLVGEGPGLYLYEESDEPGEIRVLAKVPNIDAAYRILDILGACVITQKTTNARAV